MPASIFDMLLFLTCLQIFALINTSNNSFYFQSKHSVYFQAYLWGWPLNSQRFVYENQSKLV